VLTAAPELFPFTLNCTLVVFVETLVVMETAPETVAAGAGAVMVIVGGVDDDELFFMSALVRPTHPVQSKDKMKIRQ
jgi:hypothetical protein